MRQGRSYRLCRHVLAAYRRDVLLTNGGFDERFDYLEDQELSFRLAARGYRMVFQPAAVVDHQHSATLGTTCAKSKPSAIGKLKSCAAIPAEQDSHTPDHEGPRCSCQSYWSFASCWGGRSSHWAGAAEPVVGAVPRFSDGGNSLSGNDLPFTRKAWPKDRAVASLPGLAAGASLGAECGYALGLPAPIRRRSDQTANVARGLCLAPLNSVDLPLGLVFTIIALSPTVLPIKLGSEDTALFLQKHAGAGLSSGHDQILIMQGRLKP